MQLIALEIDVPTFTIVNVGIFVALHE